MKRAPLLLLCAWLLACAAPEPPRAPAPSAPAPSAPASTCRPVRLAAVAVTGCLPSAAKVIEETSLRGSGAILLATLPVTGGEARFSLVRHHPDDLRGPVRLPDAPRGWARVEGSRRLQVGGFAGLALRGFIDDKTRVAARAVAAGGAILLAEVHWPAQAELDPVLVDAFLEALRVESPWKVIVSPEGGYTIAVPALAVVVDEVRGSPPRMRVQAFGMGGDDDQDYAILAADIPPGDGRSPDEIIADMLSFPELGTGILKMKDIFLDGRRGKEVIAARHDGGFLRVRLFVGKRRAYGLTAAAKRTDALTNAEAARFFDSFQMLDP